ncbi:uncharacterized protein GBIM_13959 [Gryllus bimaculatus]|nr:uncharacterized protein GBIM_13959 [Gryllus bimaculatus]
MEQRRVTALTPVECMLLPRYWLEQNNVANVWERVRLYLNRSIPDTRAVFRAWAAERRWLRHRQHVVAQLIDRRRLDSGTTPYDVPYALRLQDIAQPHAALYSGIAVEFRGETQVHVGGEGRTRELYFLEKNLLQDASYGHVRYTVKVYVLGKWRKKLESTISRFTIVTPLDLNSIRVQEPLTLVKHGYTTRWLCWRSKTQILMGKLPCTRFVPGQEAEVMVGFKNPTAKCMPVICEFVKRFRYLKCKENLHIIFRTFFKYFENIY